MKQATKQTVKKNIANTFGSFGYLFGFFQWLWATVLYLNVIQSTTSFILPKNDMPIEQSPVPVFEIPDALSTIIIAVVVAVMVIVALYAVISVPKNIVKTSNKIVYKTAETMTPAFIKRLHKQNNKKTRIKITSGLVLAIKLLLILFPLILTAASKLLEEQSIDYSIAMIVGLGLICLSVASFAIQYLLAKLLRVKISDLW